jgi:iron complex transport system substrate-binding protein
VQQSARGRIVSATDVAARDPELILASWCGKMVKPERILARPEFAALASVQAGRIVEIKSTIILQPGPASLTDGLRALEEQIARVAQL